MSTAVADHVGPGRQRTETLFPDPAPLRVEEQDLSTIPWLRVVASIRVWRRRGAASR